MTIKTALNMENIVGDDVLSVPLPVRAI